MFKEGETFEGFKLLKNCGSGAYGSVFYCQDISGRKMALKIISKNQIGESWKQELKGVSDYRRITDNTRGLLQIYHVSSNDEYFYYTMDAADSKSSESYLPDTLAARLKKGPLPQDQLWPVLSEIFKGLKLIHENGFVHRDIKPENILFVEGKPKLADIGLISSLSVTMTKMAGTLAYLPPEVRSSPELMDSADRETRRRNDLYAFGMVIYCTVSGKDPKEYPSLPPSLELTLPVKYFWQLSRELCDKNPEQRIVSMSDLRKEFIRIGRALQYGEDWLSESNHTFGRFGRFLKSAFINTGLWLSKYAWIVLLLILIAILVTLSITEKHRNSAPADTQLQNQRDPGH